MKHVDKYNHLFFTEDSKNNDLRNINFWNILSDFDRRHPEAGLTIFHDVKKDHFTDRYVEFLEFQCNQESETRQVQEIYDKHYYLYPLVFQPFLDREPTDEEIRNVESRK